MVNYLSCWEVTQSGIRWRWHQDYCRNLHGGAASIECALCCCAHCYRHMLARRLALLIGTGAALLMPTTFRDA